MTDRTFTVTFRAIIIGLLWLAGGVLAVVNIFVDRDLSLVGALCIGAAMVQSISARLDRHQREWTLGYEMGRESVRRLRSQD